MWRGKREGCGDDPIATRAGDCPSDHMRASVLISISMSGIAAAQLFKNPTASNHHAPSRVRDRETKK